MKSFLHLALFILFSFQLIAEEIKVLKLVGESKLISLKRSKIENLKKNSELFFGDTVQTSKGAMVHLQFPKGKTLLVKENSSLKLQGKAKHPIISFDKGEFLMGLKVKLKADETFTVKTPSAVVGVRGTLFWGLSDDQLKSTFACFESKIEVSARGKSVVLNPGEKVEIHYDEAPGNVTPARVPLSYLDTFNIDGSTSGIKDILKP